VVEGVVIVVIAAIAGRLVPVVAGWLAEQTGHSRRTAELAAATSGLSLIVRGRDTGPFEEQGKAAARAPHPATN
jgi:hypothetical protein